MKEGAFREKLTDEQSFLQIQTRRPLKERPGCRRFNQILYTKYHGVTAGGLINNTGRLPKGVFSPSWCQFIVIDCTLEVLIFTIGKRLILV